MENLLKIILSYELNLPVVWKIFDIRTFSLSSLKSTSFGLSFGEKIVKISLDQNFNFKNWMKMREFSDLFYLFPS